MYSLDISDLSGKGKFNLHYVHIRIQSLLELSWQHKTNNKCKCMSFKQLKLVIFHKPKVTLVLQQKKKYICSKGK